MEKPRIGIVIGTTRPGRFADKPTNWITALANARGDALVECIDLRDYPLPFFEEARAPIYAPPDNAVAHELARRIDSFDGYIFVTAEYNHGIPGVLKNALDYIYGPMTRKPAAFLGYGGVGGARAIEQLRQVAIELQMAPLRNAVHIGVMEFRALQKTATFEDYPYLADAAHVLLDDLVWWSLALRRGRTGA